MLCWTILNFSNILKGYGTELRILKIILKTYPDNKLEGIKMTSNSNSKTVSVERVLNRAFIRIIRGRSNIDLTDVFLSLLSESKSWAYYYIMESNQ